MDHKKVVNKKVASPIYENAIDSLRIGMEFFLKEDGYSSRRHAILIFVPCNRAASEGAQTNGKRSAARGNLLKARLDIEHELSEWCE
jgi:hypothetical protein